MEVNLETDFSEGRGNPKRAKRATDDYYDDVEGGGGGEKKPSSTQPSSTHVVDVMSKNTSEANRKVSFSSNDVSNSFNMERLRHLVIDLTLLDASATLTDFSVGMSGQVRSTKSNEVSPYRVPFPFRLPYNTQRRMVEIIISQYSVNSLLYLAHRTNSLLFHVDSRFPMIGNVLKTSCTVDEVCITDQVEEVGATYPNKKLELIIRTTQPPVVTFLKDEMRLTLEGRCLFFLEGTRQKVGVIPFSAEASIQLQTIGPLLKGKLSITRLTFTKGVEFFGLNIDDLEGLRKAAKMALENLANVIFGAGIPLTASNLNSPLRLSAVHVSVLPEVVLLQGNVDLYSSFYSRST